MADADRMTIQEVVRQVLLDEHADVIREAVKSVCAELMELEVSELIGAERGERLPPGSSPSPPTRSPTRRCCSGRPRSSPSGIPSVVTRTG
jgi:hypothetical protein